MNSNSWCGSHPLFFQEDNRNIIGSELKPGANSKFDWTGLALYLQAGYCMYGLTPFDNYSFLQANEAMNQGVITSNNVEYLEHLVSKPSVTPESAIEAIRRWVHELEKSTNEKFVIPLSGGLDSRLLISFIQDKSRIEAFTYGQSWTQSRSNEVVTAMALSKKLNFKWQHIELEGYSRLTSEWISKWGSSTHAHGMYQMQFYEKISKIVPPGSIVLSGIIGDLLAGSLPERRFAQPNDLWGLTLSREMNARNIMHKLERPFGKSLEERILSNEYQKYEHLLEHKRATDLLTIQNKNMLLRYLVKVPNWYGLRTESPFLNEEIGLKILCINEDERRERKWQHEYLESIGIGDTNLGNPGLFSNVLNFSEINKGYITAADIIEGSKLLDINTQKQMIEGIEHLRTARYRIFLQLEESRILKNIGRIFKRLSRKRLNEGLTMYYSYLTLLPLEKMRDNDTL
jgi:hypothetical protein